MVRSMTSVCSLLRGTTSNQCDSTFSPLLPSLMASSPILRSWPTSVSSDFSDEGVDDDVPLSLFETRPDTSSGRTIRSPSLRSAGLSPRSLLATESATNRVTWSGCTVRGVT